MKITVSKKAPKKHAPGRLMSTHIEYDSEGDGASVMHHYAPKEGEKSDTWAPGPSPKKKSFSSRIEAHHQANQEAGIQSEMVDARAHGKPDSSDGMAGAGESEGDEDEDEMESEGADDDPGAQPMLSRSKKPARKV